MLNPLHRQILGLFLARLELIENHMQALDRMIATALRKHNDAVLRLPEVPGFGVDSAQQVITEVGPAAATFPSPEQLSSWVGACPGREESAEVSVSNRSPKGNRAMRRVLNQVANADVKGKGSIFQAVYRRMLPRMRHSKSNLGCRAPQCADSYRRPSIIGCATLNSATDPMPAP
jgi:transposase